VVALSDFDSYGKHGYDRPFDLVVQLPLTFPKKKKLTKQYIPSSHRYQNDSHSCIEITQTRPESSKGNRVV
jgi:hypothetical protein